MSSAQVRTTPLGACALLAAAASIAVRCALHMPGESPDALPALSAEQAGSASRLQTHVETLAERIGPRDLGTHPDALGAAADYIVAQLVSTGYEVREQRFVVGGRTARNLEASRGGRGADPQSVVIGAHYDTDPGTPGADDNGSGVAALLELARLAADDAPARTIRFVAFANEEPPYFQTGDMGSVRYADSLAKRGERVAAMLSLETLGYYTTAKGSQHYPALLRAAYPDTGDFVAFVGDLESRELVRRCVAAFRAQAVLPAEGTALSRSVRGVGWSDHWAFWQAGYRAAMVTDTAPFRNPNYHEPTDTPDTLDYDRLARAVTGLAAVLRDLCGPSAP